MQTDNTTRDISGGLLFVAGVILIILKLAGVIDWAWWIVLLPMWLPVALFVVIAIVVVVIALIVQLIRRSR